MVLVRPDHPKDKPQPLTPVEARRKPFDLLPQYEDGTINVSPGAIRDPIATMLAHVGDLGLRQMMFIGTGVAPSLKPLIAAATTPEPLRPALTRPIVDAWSMTSLKMHTGRPEVAPWLRGWVNEDTQTAVVWRAHLPTRASEKVEDEEIEAFFEAAPTHTSELLDGETWQVKEWLLKRAANCADASAFDRSQVVAFAFGPSGDLRQQIKLKHLLFESKDKKEKERVDRLLGSLTEGTVIVDARLGGLTMDGLLESRENRIPDTLDSDSGWKPDPPFRVRQFGVEAEPRWQIVHRFVKESPEDDEPSEGLVVEKQRGDITTEESRAVGNAQLLADHQREAERLASELGARLGLGDAHKKMLRIAARHHDEGKRAGRWQRAFNAPRDGQIYAKTRGPVNVALLEGYRHEFRSVEDAKKDVEFHELRNGLNELCLHLIAAHHGYARPVIGTGGWDDRPPSMLVGPARAVAERFARLQREWGPWGLAWWESLLRAVDQQASRENDMAKDAPEAGE